jgi:septal ring factor EnvC (AmiA/AmiB activator)
VTAADICGTFAAIFALIAAIAILRIRLYRHDLQHSETARRVLGQTNVRLRSDLTAVEAREAHTKDELAASLTTIAELREELEKGLRWRNELSQARAEFDSHLMNPHPRRSRDERRAEIVREAWSSAWNARFYAPAVIPPHEQQRDQQDGADQ